MLGKGLESLIPKRNKSLTGDDYQKEEGATSSFSDDGVLKEDSAVTPPSTDGEFEIKEPPRIEGPIFHIEVEKIRVNPYQPRKIFDDESLKELASSIREFGVLQPLVVSKMEEENEFGTSVSYQLIAGQRRLMASKLIGLKTVPVVVKSALKKTEALEMAIVENIQRADLNIIETARAYARLSDEFGLTQREIASRLGKSREKIANALRLLDLPSEIQEAISSGVINESQARLLLQINDPIKQRDFFSQIISQNLSVRDLKKMMGKNVEDTLGREIKPLKTDDIQMKGLERELSDFLGAPVKVEFSRSGGKIVIHFYSPEEAFGIANKIRPEE